MDLETKARIGKRLLKWLNDDNDEPFNWPDPDPSRRAAEEKDLHLFKQLLRQSSEGSTQKSECSEGSTQKSELKTFHIICVPTGLGFQAVNITMMKQIDEALGDRYDADKKRFFSEVSWGGEIRPLDLDASRMYSYVRTLRKLAKERGDRDAVQAIEAAITTHLQKTQKLLMM
jgi:hypothetical protein